MPPTRDKDSNKQSAIDTDPPPYLAINRELPTYSNPPSYKSTVCASSNTVHIDVRVFRSPSQIRLSPLDFLLLKRGERLPYVYRMQHSMGDCKGKGLRVAVKWCAKQVYGVQWEQSRGEDVDDYGRWAGGNLG